MHEQTTRVLARIWNWLTENIGYMAQMFFLTFTVIVTSITTGLGLHMAMKLNMGDNLAIILATGTTIVIGMMLLICWRQFIKVIRHYGIWRSATVIGILIYLPFVFVGSTWWSVVGIGGGQAFSLGLQDTVITWKKQVYGEFSRDRDYDSNLIDLVGGVCDIATELEIQEEKGGVSGDPGRGTLTSSYARAKITTCEQVELLECEQAEKDNAEEDAIVIIDALMSTLRSGDDLEGMEVMFMSAQSEIESLTNRSSGTFSPQALSLTLTQAKPPQEAIDRTSGQRQESLQQLVAMIEELQDYLDNQEEIRSEGGTVFSLSGIRSPSSAVFVYFKDIVGIWGASLVVDFIPLVLILFAAGSHARRKKNLPSVVKELEENKTKLNQTKTKLDTAQTDLEQAVEKREAEVEAAAKAKSDELEAKLTADKADLEGELDGLRTSIQRTQDKLTHAQNELEAYLKTIESKREQQERNLLEERLRMEDDTHAQIENLEEAAGEIRSKIDELERKRKGLEDSDPTMLASRLASTQQLHSDLEKALEKTQQELAQARTDYRKMVDSNIGQQDDIKALELEVDQLSTKVTVLTSDLASEHDRLTQTRESLDLRSAQVAELAPEADRAVNLDSELEALNQRFAAAQERIHELESTTTNQRVDLDRAQTHIAELERSKAHLTEEHIRLERVRAELEQQVANLKRRYGKLEASVVVVEADISDLDELDEVDEEEFHRSFDGFSLEDDPQQTKSIALVEDPAAAEGDPSHDSMDSLIDVQMTGHPDPDESSEDSDDDPADLARTTMVSPGDIPIPPPPPSADAPDAESIDTAPDTKPKPKK